MYTYVNIDYGDGLGYRTRTFNVIDGMGMIISKITSVTVPLNEDKTLFAVQFSFLSPKDFKKYSKKKGKMIAMNRLESFREIAFEKADNQSIIEILKCLIIKEAKRKNIIWMKNISLRNLV